ncbi:hypothetical protein LZ654_20685 [Lelliottia amnigena]|uniref:hypothetical protein n=1 Tax=Lelliottia amnigena TaxID=61646 RepID=UPI001F455DCB|nr:hypothetical protein [Lelliottia amnigena]MCE9967226.1 hypothetical protein [Lelliottia amnigena]
MSSQNLSRYSSLVFYIQEETKQFFIDECSKVGLEAKKVQCFSANPSIKDFLSIIFERGQKFAPQVLKVLNMLQRKSSIRIEVAADRKIINLSGVSTEDALKLIQAADAIKITDTESDLISDVSHPPVHNN